MKKLVVIIFISAIISCNTDKKNEAPGSENLPGVQNVNGNIPDTTNSINISNNKTDSATSKDSLNK